MKWWESTLTVLDTETTGTDPATARIVELALLRVNPEGRMLPDSFHCIVNPGCEIPAEAAAVHGITTERARSEGADPAMAIGTAAMHLHRLALAGGPLVVMNARYDYPLLIAEGKRHGFEVPTDLHIIDPGVMDRKLDKYRKGSRKLADLARFYGVPLDEAHAAGADAVATAGVARAIAIRNALVRQLDLPSLQAVQATWFAEWRDHLNGYWAKQGKTDRVEGSWPFGTLDLAKEAAG